MPTYLIHLIGIAAPAETIYRAITTILVSTNVQRRRRDIFVETRRENFPSSVRSEIF